MRPAYWEGPVYEIRRGTWFLGKTPLSTQIADQLEEAYLRLKPGTRYEADEGLLEDDIQPLTSTIISEVNLYEKKHGKKWPFEDPGSFEATDKIAVFKDHRVAFLVDKNSTIGKLQVENFYRLPTQQVIGADTVTRGYVHSKSKESVNKTTTAEQEKQKETDFISALVSNFSGSEKSNELFQNDLEGDYSNDPSLLANSGDREVDHLIFGVHGIGQSLSSKFSGVNFAHDCNNMRRLLKTVYSDKSKFSNMAYSEEEINSTEVDTSNCKVQILPIVWRYDVDFSLDRIYEDYEKDGSLRLPTLSQLNIDTITPFRNIAADVFMDILLYYEPKFNREIMSSVIRNANEMYDKYTQRHPNFDGKVSFMGHSLGSVLCLDILSQQPEEIPTGDAFDPTRHLKFKVENFFGVGSPNGVFKFIRRQNIRPRELYPMENKEPTSDSSVQAPNAKNYYNIFYVTDPVAYRVEPLIHTSLSKYRPKVIPFYDKNSGVPVEIMKIPFVKSLMDYSALGPYIEKLAEGTAASFSKGPEVDMQLEPHVEKMLRKLNKTGRVDYSLPQGMFGIDLINAVGSHTEYFNDRNVAGFLLSQLWLDQKSDKPLKGHKYEELLVPTKTPADNSK
ncbi:hypothetical protein CANARDRAFT_195807 [[Candida] arabinofermentans NRRL YB-2248]|uniref:DDHD domain-containing protein n=1 Tax=[Candida] arabinofermentans NRRL YB-2248 TaxID=983967 RepID=A0A1E4T4D4_9ASCO|nr:hypothetical protein CANARDRAFT_195807 [[Candida] arabinofermentans NRRL YB-2248]